MQKYDALVINSRIVPLLFIYFLKSVDCLK